MSDIVIKEVQSKGDLKAFVKFPFKLYANNKCWVPPIIKDEMEDFNPNKNPSYEHAVTKNWLAYQNGEIVGRICAIKHGAEFEAERKVRFGWIDFIDDIEVSKALLIAMENWAKNQGAKEVHGPLGFTDMDMEGMLVEGFDVPGTIASIYNYSYYPNHLIQLGYTKAVDWVEMQHEFQEDIPEKIKRIASYVEDRFGFKRIPLKSTKDIVIYGEKLFETLNESYSDLYGFYKITPNEAKRIVKKYLSFLSPKYVALIGDDNGQVVAFGVCMPSLTKAYQRANGRLFPFGFIPILKDLKLNKSLDLYLIAALPEFQKSGVIMMVFHELWKSFIKEGVTSFRTNPMLEHNNNLLNIWRTLGGKSSIVETKKIKHRRCFSKRLV
jgi:hypothetical protein